MIIIFYFRLASLRFETGKKKTKSMHRFSRVFLPSGTGNVEELIICQTAQPLLK